MTVMDAAAQVLAARWVPKWHEVFTDPETGLFFERVDRTFRPVATGRRRLLSQLRQLAMYAHAARRKDTLLFRGLFLFRPDLEAAFTAITRHFSRENGVWRFALDDACAPLDDTQDLYTQAFVIFAAAHYGRATGDPAARATALEAAGHIDTAFRDGMDAGFAEALDAHGTPVADTPRRHESHMHLLEAVLEAGSLWDDAIFRRLADEIVALFHARFYDAGTHCLSEYFTPDLAPLPDAQSGRIICEPGHYYEWIWLLKKHAARAHDATCLRLLAWANAHGWDAQYGGIYDELDPNGTPVRDTKRLWPLTEALKANALLLDIAPDRDAAKDLMARVAALLNGVYIEKRGFWTEWRNRDLSPATDYMPATTPYHVYFGVMEARDALRARGASKSLRAGPRMAVYAVARAASALVRAARFKLKKVRPVRD
ncbi:MAG: AGE family epimerase/isomerase [Rhodospirillales bacterium]|nr:AGE family epimerase/isomerase [Alphaproteobacteria bacterium]MCB9986327.1 AGE family epimerase/isomerase [Rhodospirillales bacterium]USO08617.1 MAG: AGE family epimerase/isomerase [Rhodospirillales bacterium]